MKAIAASLALILVAWFVAGLVRSPTEPNREAIIEEHARKQALFRAVMAPLIEDLAACRWALWEAADKLHDHCKENYPEWIGTIRLEKGRTMREKFARASSRPSGPAAVVGRMARVGVRQAGVEVW